MKKFINKLVSLTLVLCMSLTLVAPVVKAAKLNETGKITVENVEAGVTVSAYRLMNVNVDTTVNQPKDPVYSWVDAVQTWIDANYPDYSDANDFTAPNVADKGTDVAEFYDKLSAAIKGGTVNLTVEGTREGSGTIDNLKMGNYLVLIENGMKVYKPSAVNLIPEYVNNDWQISEATVEVKASDAALTKEVDHQDTFIGDEVTYTVTTDVPQYPANARNKNYIVSDNMDEGLTFQMDTFAVRGVVHKGDEETAWVEIPASAYALGVDAKKLVTDASVGVDFQAEFTYADIKGYEQLVITYKATVNTDAKLGEVGNNNTAYLEYNNNPYGVNDYKEYDDSTVVYTYGLDVTKVGDKEADLEGLAGAEFELSKENDKDNYTAIKFVEIEAGHYRLALDGEENAVTTLVVDENGKLYVDGLATGTYYFHETKAPGGYNKPNVLFEVTISDEDTNGKPVVDGEEIASGYVALTIKNNSGFKLPETGGIGTILFTVGGIVLMGLGVLIIKNIRKKGNN